MKNLFKNLFLVGLASMLAVGAVNAKSKKHNASQTEDNASATVASEPVADSSASSTMGDAKSTK